MAHVWSRDSSEPDGEWVPLPLAGDTLALHPATLLCRSGTDAGVWVLIGSPAVSVNGAPLDTGIRVLRDRDELRADGRRTFFSAESLAGVVPFPGGDRPVSCPRCKLAIAAASPAVRCPQCGVWHHQDEAAELPCWTYRDRCALCDQPSALDAGFRWSPEAL